ncbi:MAG: hypothetical protein M0C28_30610 [Candidatus Moduliflexus flocculans]|nr:hypothetical protein [Candidatus Moduliflexus flocculans]
MLAIRCFEISIQQLRGTMPPYPDQRRKALELARVGFAEGRRPFELLRRMKAPFNWPNQPQPGCATTKATLHALEAKQPRGVNGGSPSKISLMLLNP